MTVLIFLFKMNLKIVYFFLKMLKTNNKKILLMSRQSYEKSIDFELIENDIKKRYPDYKVVILTKMLNKKNAIKYYFHIYRQMYHLATSKVCLVDTYIIPVSILKHKKDLKIIQLCHGIGNIKKFGYQTAKNKKGKNNKLSKLMNMHCNYDYLISTSKETSNYYSEAFNMPLYKILEIGNPKIDYILNVKSKRKEIYKKYPKLKKKPVILYVSTFRKYKDDYLKKFVAAIPNDKYNIIMHIHPIAYKYHPNIDNEITDDRIFRCKDIKSVDLLSIADIVITDYSSFVFESAILGIPTYLYVSDYDKYTKKNGLNVDIFKELPGYVFKDAEELFKKINRNKYNKKILLNFREKYVENCDGKATEKLVDFLIENCEL